VMVMMMTVIVMQHSVFLLKSYPMWLGIRKFSQQIM